MRVCIPTEDAEGIESVLAAHFGRAPYLTLVDADGRCVEVLPNERGGSTHGSCDPVAAIRSAGADAVICLGLGRGALSALNAAGIPVYITTEGLTAFALDALSGGRLQKAELEVACGGGHGECHH